MKVYAQLNKNDICIGISFLSGEVNSPDVVDITNEENKDYDYFVWRKYNRETQEWSEEKFEPKTTAPLDEFEELKQRFEELEQAILELSMLITGGVD